MTSALDQQGIQQRLSKRVSEYKNLSDRLSRHQEDITKTWMRLSALHDSITSLTELWHQSVMKPGIEAFKKGSSASPESETAVVYFDDYRLIDFIGHGPHTTAYLAVDTKTDQRVAIEILLPDFSEDPHVLDKFRQDIDTIKAFRHEAIVPIYDFDSFQGQSYLVSRYLPNGSLQDVIEQSGKGHMILPAATIQSLINRLAAALEAAHDKGIVHGNIKPSNILCNEKRMWFLSHFGFIQLTDRVKTISYHFTEPSPYLAPEQWDGQAIGPRTDIYQLGVILFQLLTGQHPFMADELGRLIQNHVEAPLPSVVEINDRLPASCQQVLEKAMAKSPQDRYETPGQLAAALGRALIKEQIENRFLVNYEIGKGATATVYLAHDQSMKRDVAIKLLPVSHTKDDRKRFEKEVQTIAGLKHNSIVMVHDVGEHQGIPFLVMEYMSGGTLHDKRHQLPGPMPWSAVHPILKRLTAALTAAHRANIIHCDIKPGNVLLDAEGRYYLSDFGISRHLDHTVTAAVSGTPAYMAPEQCKGGQIGPQTDVYQLAVMTFELLTGRLPYTGSSIPELLQQHLQAPVPYAREFLPDLPQACEDVLRRAMAKEPRDRYASPRAFFRYLSLAMITQNIDRYQVKEVLGRGMATVYRAHDTAMGRDVAIKMIVSTLDSPDFLSRFQHEAQLLAGLEHSAIVRVYDYGEYEDHIPYLVMQYMAGGTLRDRLQATKGPMEPSKIVKILQRLVSALEAVHRKQTIHCDIKPENVLFDHEGVAFLADFGISQRIDHGEKSSTSGTVYYMSPEQWENKPLSSATDVYQLGVMLFEMLTGERPFSGSIHALMNQHINEPVPSALAVHPDLPSQCDTILAKAMEKRPEKRYANPSDLAEALIPVLTNIETDLNDPEPDKIGRYEMRHLLGRGGMATVYLAFDPAFDREVALKMIKPEMAQDVVFRGRFEREAKTIARLEHRAIVPVYDFGKEANSLYLVMRYMGGGTLADLFKERPLTIAEAAKIFNRICPALDHAHKKGIVHRDLKPANILLDRDHEPYLSDFGIVKLLEEEDTSLSQSGNLLGTMAYMSPEQLEGGEVDGRSDVYALGVILFELLTGEKPYSGNPIMSVIQRHNQEDVPRINEFNPNIPFNFQKIIEKALAKDPNARFNSALELMSALGKFDSRESDVVVIQKGKKRPDDSKPPIKPPVQATPPDLSLPSAKTTFHYEGPVAPDDFVGRKSILRILTNRIRNKQSTAVTGLPQYGKSSLLQKLAAEAQEWSHLNIIPSALPLKKLLYEHTSVEFWHEVLQPLQQGVNNPRIQKLYAQARQRKFDRRYLKRIFELLNRQSITLLLMLDDFEQLVHHPQFQAPDFYALLRSLATTTGSLVIVTASRLTVTEISQQYGSLLELGSPFFNIMIEERLRPFSAESAYQILNKKSANLSPAAQSHILDIAGHLPVLLQMTAAIWAGTDCNEHSIAQNSFFQSQSDSLFTDLWATLEQEEQKLCLVMALLHNRKQQLTLSHFDNADNLSFLVEDLVNKGLVTEEHLPNAGLLQIEGRNRQLAPTAFVWWLLQKLRQDKKWQDYNSWFSKYRWLTDIQWNELLMDIE